MDWLLGLRPPMAGVFLFLVGSLTGALLLSTPWASASGEWTDPIDCLFTATSAICVTGLTVVDTGSHWSGFGRGVILVLIQAGGIGIMTLSAFVVWMLRRRLSFRSEDALVKAMDHNGISMRHVVGFIVRLTFACEAAGALLLYGVWHADPRFESVGEALYHSVFHSVSAFCNAGFSLYRDNLEGWRDHAPVNLIVMALVVLGGLGFPVIANVKAWLGGRDPTTGGRVKLSVQTRLVFTATAVLLAGGTALFLALEWRGTLASLDLPHKLLAAAFQAVTPRTAGFNTVPIGALLPPTALMVMVLMFIGGSPGSTAGGIKTTTFAVLVASIRATIRGRREVEVFGHTIPAMSVKRAIVILFLSVTVVSGAAFLLLLTEKHAPLDVLFEAVSAFGTVGLSRGITAGLSEVGKLIVAALMLAGRLGPLTLLLAIGGLEDRADYRYPDARVMIG